MIETQTAMEPPDNGGVALALAGDWPDDVRDLGDRIAALTPLQADELLEYLATMRIKFPTFDEDLRCCWGPS